MPSVSDLIPISRITHRYYIYDLEHVKRCREEHGILGVFVGTLPQYSQQNIFLGLPQELMAEEARLLVEIGVGYIVDDVDVHTNQLKSLSRDERWKYKRALSHRGLELAKVDSQRADENTRRALARMSPEKRLQIEAKLAEKRRGLESRLSNPREVSGDDESLFSGPSRPDSRASVSTESAAVTIRPRLITPTTSIPLGSAVSSPPMNPSPTVHESLSPFESMSGSSTTEALDLPPVPSLPAYALYKHLHSLAYFQSPGLRFGCQFCVYPGDPLRFHSHFLARGYGWNDDIDLLSLVGGGRLGTGVKKGFLIGGPVGEKVGHDEPIGDVATFCIEWAGM